MSGTEHQHDVVIVGARAAGSAAALLLARLGHDVVVVDRAQFPSDTLSTHSIARSGTVQLARWGLLDTVLAAGTPPIRQATIHVGDEHIVRTIKDRAGVDMIVSPRRYVLDTILADAASAAGADVRFGVSVTGVQRAGDGRVVGITTEDADGVRSEITARITVGADGLRSKIARAVGAPIVEAHNPGGAVHYAYYAGIPWAGNEYIISDGRFAGVFPTNDGEACIWVCTPTEEAEAARRREGAPGPAYDALLSAAAPELVERLRHAERRSTVHGILSTPNQLRQPAGPGWALVGDAGYHRDPITGNGISDAFRDAELLAVALDDALTGRTDEHEALARYGSERDAALRDVFEITYALSAYPALPRFAELFRALSKAIDAEATWLAARPFPEARALAVA